jgi:25S rRNA (uracil2634-N3)-methyltransferase
MAHKNLKGRKSRGSLRNSALVLKKGKKRQDGKKGAQRPGNSAVKEKQSSEQTVAGPARTKESKAAARAQAAIEQQHRDLYTPGDRILLVGEGNFSFARALCRNLGEGECSGLYATAFDNEATLKRKYPDVVEFRREVEEKFHATTLVGVDATRLHKVKEFRGAFRKIVFNFPHLGDGESDVEKSVANHRKLLADFFVSASKCLAEEKGAAIHVALKTGEPYKSWKIAQTVRMACPEIDLVTAVPFVASAFEGYSHRRTHGFDERVSKVDSQELAKGAKVYVFGRRKQKQI